MTIEKAIEMIDEYLMEPNSIHQDWVDLLVMCRRALLNNNEKHSKWEICFDGYYPYCSNCDYEPDKLTDYCPQCGHRMDGDIDA